CHRLFLSIPRPPPGSPLFPYTTLFRSLLVRSKAGGDACHRHMYGFQLKGGLTGRPGCGFRGERYVALGRWRRRGSVFVLWTVRRDRKSTRLNSSHVAISYAVFCLKKKN